MSETNMKLITMKQTIVDKCKELLLRKNGNNSFGSMGGIDYSRMGV